eukprot:2375109-Alexandrium_andersonii.AAC.1
MAGKPENVEKGWELVQNCPMCGVSDGGISGAVLRCFFEQFNVPVEELKKGRASAPFVDEPPRGILQCPGQCSICKS